MRPPVFATTSDGVKLHIDRVPAIGERRGVVVCLHAMMTDGRYFGAQRDGSFAAELAAAGFDVLVPDFRGHGKSRPPTAGPDDWSFDDLVELDLPAIVEAAARESQCAPSDLVLLGHSLGGLVTTAALGVGAIPSPKLVLLPATSVWLLGPNGDPRRRALMTTYRVSARLLGRAPIRALRIGSSDEAKTYVEQLTGWTRAAKWTSLRGIDYLENLETIETRVLPFAGAGDWMCTPRDARGFAEHMPNAAPVRVIGKQHGDAIDANHFQLFTRSELRPLWRELVVWLEKQ
jgi:predicted alpha/beta hydrolase